MRKTMIDQPSNIIKQLTRLLRSLPGIHIFYSQIPNIKPDDIQALDSFPLWENPSFPSMVS
jgi:hypothetical protein